MLRLLVIGAGGFIGSVLRYLVSGLIQRSLGSFEFPFGTLTVNVSGCFVLGFLVQLAEAYGLFSSDTRAFLFIGLLGGFTTFSTFGSETWNLMRDREMGFVAVNLTAHVVLGLAAVWAGRSIVHTIWR
jgi:fluoride exporter